MANIGREDAQPGADDLEILFPKDKTITIRGEQVTFKEYGFYAGLVIRNAAKGFIQELAAAIACEEQEMLSKVDTAFENHTSVVLDCVAMACGKPKLWVIGLDEADSRAVDHAWWDVCGSFFVRCAKRNLHSAKTPTTDVGQTFGQHSSDAVTRPAS